VVGGVVQTFQQKYAIQMIIITISNTALSIFSATCVVTGIFIPIAWLNAPMKRANIKNRMTPTKSPRITAATILSASGVGSFSAIKSLSHHVIYSNWHYLNNTSFSGEKVISLIRCLLPIFFKTLSIQPNLPISENCNKILIITTGVSISPTLKTPKSLQNS
jgi:hypothetical protein